MFEVNSSVTKAWQQLSDIKATNNKHAALHYFLSGVDGNHVCTTHPLLASRLMRIMETDETETAQKVKTLIQERLVREVGSEFMNLPEGVLEFLYEYNLNSKKFTDKQLSDTFHYAIQNQDMGLFNQVASVLWPFESLKLIDSSVIVCPRLLPCFLENSVRGSLLRNYCTGVTMETSQFELSFLLKYLPQEARDRITTLYIDTRSYPQILPDSFSKLIKVKRLVIHTEKFDQAESLFLDSYRGLPHLKEIVFDEVVMADTTFKKDTFHQFSHEFCCRASNYLIALNNMCVQGQRSKEQMRNMVDLPENPTWNRLTTESMYKRAGTGEIPTRDWTSSAGPLASLLPEITKTVPNEVELPIVSILKSVNAEWVDACSDEKFLSWFLLEVEWCYNMCVLKRGDITTITDLLSQKRLPWEKKGPRTVLKAVDGTLVEFSTLALIIKVDSYNKLGTLGAPACALQAFAKWLEGDSLQVTGQELLDVDLLAGKLGIEGFQKNYSIDSLYSLSEAQAQKFLLRYGHEECRNLVKGNWKHVFYEKRIFLYPEELLKYISTPVPFLRLFDRYIEGILFFRNEMMLELLLNKGALQYIKGLLFNGSTYGGIKEFADGCPNLNNIILLKPRSTPIILHKEFKKLSGLSYRIFLSLENLTIVCEEESKWDDLQIKSHLFYKNVKVRAGDKMIPTENYFPTR